jgi:hypothetical protein
MEIYMQQPIQPQYYGQPQQQPQVVYVTQQGSSGFNVLMWLLVFMVLGIGGVCCLIFFLPGILYSMSTSITALPVTMISGK